MGGGEIGNMHSLMYRYSTLSHCSTHLSQCYWKQEMKKKRVYEEQIREVQHGTFLLLVFTTAGGIGPTTTFGSPLLLLRNTTGLWEDAASHQMQTKLLSAEIRHHVSVRHMMAGDIIDLSTTEGRVTEHFTDYCAHSYFYYYSLFPFS